MITDKDITFICHVRLENVLRIKNISTIYAFYKKYLPNSRFIFVEDTAEPALSTHIILDNNDKIIHFLNNDEYNKCEGYNIGAKHSETDILIFLDIDIIVDCNHLLKSINKMDELNQLNCLLIGYNGVAIYLNDAGEKEFLQSLDLNDLYNKTISLQLTTNNRNEYALVGNTQAVGGCLVMSKTTFNTIHGFNPSFVGWGYEDNEIISRARILQVDVYKSNIVNHFLFHLPHETVALNKSLHIHYKQNEETVRYVESLTKEQLEKYIQLW